MFKRKHKISSAIDLNSHRKRYLMIILVFVFSILIIFIYTLSKPQNISKYQTTTYSQMGDLNLITDKVTYDSSKQELRIGILVTNQAMGSNSKTKSETNFNDMMNNLDNDSEILETMNNIKFKAEAIGIKQQNVKLPNQVRIINSDYLVINVQQVPASEPLIRVVLTPKVMNKNVNSSISSNNNSSIRSYFLRKDYVKQPLTDASYSYKFDADKAKIKLIKQVIKRGQKENLSLQKDIQDKQKLVAKVQNLEKIDSDSSLENHRTQVQSYQSTIKQDQSQIDSINQKISSLKKQIQSINQN